jgi:hypothetical protein
MRPYTALRYEPTRINSGDRATFYFGTVGVYDGHQANVGRIAVDSTWHHFFDINLIGDPIAVIANQNDIAGASEQKGFTNSTNGKEVLAGMPTTTATSRCGSRVRTPRATCSRR